GTPLLQDGAAAARLAQAGFRTGVPLPLRLVPGMSRTLNVIDRVPTLGDVGRAMTGFRKGGFWWIWRVEPENRLLTQAPLLVAINRGLFGGGLPQAATAVSVLTFNGVLEVVSPDVARSRGINFSTALGEVNGIGGQAFAVAPGGQFPVAHLPTHVVRPGDNL